MRWKWRWWIVFLIMSSSLLLLVSCTPDPAATIPTIGPIQQGTGQPASATITLSANINCAEIGEIITFTLTLENRETYPLTLTGNPLVEITIEPRRIGGGGASIAWSQTTTYPATIDPVIQPGETRVYQWPFRVDPSYAQDAIYSRASAIC